MSVTIKDKELAESGQRIFKKKAKGKLIIGFGDDKTVRVPKPVERILKQAFAYVAEGKDVIVIPESTELTTQQAADLLKVSRPFLVKLLESGEIPFRKVGKHRRVAEADVVNYKNNIDKQRANTLDKLAAEAQKLGLGY